MKCRIQMFRNFYFYFFTILRKMVLEKFCIFTIFEVVTQPLKIEAQSNCRRN